MQTFKAVAIPLTCGLITVAIGCANIWLGVLAAPIMYSISKSLLD